MMFFCFLTNFWREATHLAVSKSITCFHIRAISDSSSSGVLQFGNRSYPCILGGKGRSHLKREGDGKSPKGSFRITGLKFRSDRVSRPRTPINVERLKPNLGWCDDVASNRYNRPVKLPFSKSHEELWRQDCCYDILATTDHNQRPRVRGLGSAIFLHLARPGQKGTEGCIALSRRDMRAVLARSSGSLLLCI
jgi:L,D-peptidoglycan transpeptidase YkuD (ErfK/YbiS/YcfS/YnhG family)